jgi:hypothetical protein
VRVALCASAAELESHSVLSLPGWQLFTFRQNTKSYISSDADASAGVCCHHVAIRAVNYLISSDLASGQYGKCIVQPQGSYQRG